jgi:hypothetical protein
MVPARSFRAAVEARDLDALAGTLAADVVLHSPVTFRPYEGRAAVAALLRLIAGTFEDFRYTDELHSAEGVEVLVFRARVGARELEGVDILRLDGDGLVADLTAIVRPLSGLAALAEAMGAQVKAAGLDTAA